MSVKDWCFSRLLALNQPLDVRVYPGTRQRVGMAFMSESAGTPSLIDKGLEKGGSQNTGLEKQGHHL